MPDSLATANGARPLDEHVADLQAQVARLQEELATLKAEQHRLRWAATHDELTGLPNRRLLHTLAPRLLDVATTGRPAVVIVLDLNGFKPINDTLGHHVGDHVLRTVARRLATLAAAGHLVARLGGDEFAAVLTYPFPTRRPTWWRPIVDALCMAVGEPIPAAGGTLTVAASVGVAPARPPARIADLLRQADQAMYLAKAGGPNPAVQVCHSPTAVHAGKAGSDRAPAPREHSVGDRARRGKTRTAGQNVRTVGQNGAPPTMHPYQRDPAEIAPACTYRRNDPVWVYRDGAWRTGIVDSASSLAIMATYRRTDHHGTGVDTMTARYVLPRADADPDLDRGLARTAS
jgi:diguanylate cyclase (GGDEF)-like protein